MKQVTMTLNLYSLSLFILGSYLLAAIPFALIVSKLKGIDLRKVGSGNLGATNVYRAMGFGYAFLVFLLDAAKGAIPVYMSTQLFTNPVWHISIGFFAIAAHSLSCYVNFKGGKGVATGLGVLAALSPKIAVIIVVLAFVLIYTTRYVAPTSIICSILAPTLFYFFGYPIPYVIGLSIIALFITIRHRSNIVRLIKGEENKV